MNTSTTDDVQAMLRGLIQRTNEGTVEWVADQLSMLGRRFRARVGRQTVVVESGTGIGSLLAGPGQYSFAIHDSQGDEIFTLSPSSSEPEFGLLAELYDGASRLPKRAQEAIADIRRTLNV